MTRFIHWLTQSRRGTVVLGDFAVAASVLILGSVVGLVLIRNALLNEATAPSSSPSSRPFVLFPALPR